MLQPERPTDPDLPTRSDIRAAWDRIRPHIRETPVMTLKGSEFGLLTDIHVKFELFQHTGSFKPRGAFNTVLQLDNPQAGIAAASGGNHGAAVAFAAQQLGLKADIFVPEISSPSKIDMILSTGAELHIGGDRYADALDACLAHCERSGATNIHAYDARATVEGQGTVAAEWEAQAPGLDTLLVAVGGGGLIAGMACYHDGAKRIIAVEPDGCAAYNAASKAGHPVDVEVSGVAADSLGARSIGTLAFEAGRTGIEQSILITDGAIVAAQRLLWQKARIAAEAGGAAALAALVSGQYRPQPDERVGVLICGGNVSLASLA